MSKPIGKGGTPRTSAKTATTKKSAASPKVTGKQARRNADVEFAASVAPSTASASARPRSSAGFEAKEPPVRSPKNMLTAGIKALTSAHEEVVARQSRVFESLLGLGPKREADAGDGAPPTSALDPFGFKKFEDVFDQRVARATQHLGLPTAQAFADLTSEVERLRATVERLEAQARKR